MMTARDIAQKNQHKAAAEDLKLLLLLLAAAAVMHLTGIGCPFRLVTGIPCAGCGMSRALFHLVCGHFHEALSYHPLVFLMPPALACWLLRRRLKAAGILEHESMKVLLWAVVAAFIIVYVIRILQKDPVLAPGFEAGIIGKAYKEVRYVLSALR